MKLRKKRKYIDGIIALVIILNVLFAASVLYVFYKTGSEPTTLICSWFGFTTGELWMASSITKTKINNGTINKEDNKNEN